MSTDADCQFIEKKQNQWWYRYQKWPYGETPDYHEHGPFLSFDAAQRHMSNNYANPGGWSKLSYNKKEQDQT